MPTLDIDFDVYCSCGNGLCAQTDVKYGHRGAISVIIEPCDKCLDKAQEAGYERGFDAALEQYVEE